MRPISIAFASLLILTALLPINDASAQASDDDPHIWLEEVEGERALAWVRERNARTLGVLQGDPRYQRMYDAALRIVEATDRIAAPAFRGRVLYNFWQDSAHVRGILRRTSVESYRTASPEWETVLDIDALSTAENANWVYRGASCLAPEHRLCLVSLSNGGKDAVEVREFDVVTKSFVPGGFRLPESKGGASWVDDSTLFISRDFGPGTLTKSGYPFIVRRLRRGQRIEDAPEVFRGTADDVSASAFALRDPDGRVQALLANRGVTFYEGEYWLLRDSGGPVKLPFPAKASIRALVDDQLVMTTDTEWSGFKVGDLFAYDLSDLKADPAAARPYLILSPGPRESIEGVTATRNKLVVALYENVKGAAYVYDRGPNGWTRRKLALPENASVGIGSASSLSDELFFTTSNYLEPNSLWLSDAATGRVERVKSIAPRFDASRHTVTQYEATSADGTKIPYFVTHPKDMRLDA